jgi:hypothetical protein
LKRAADEAARFVLRDVNRAISFLPAADLFSPAAVRQDAQPQAAVAALAELPVAAAQVAQRAVEVAAGQAVQLAVVPEAAVAQVAPLAVVPEAAVARAVLPAVVPEAVAVWVALRAVVAEPAAPLVAAAPVALPDVAAPQVEAMVVPIDVAEPAATAADSAAASDARAALAAHLDARVVTQAVAVAAKQPAVSPQAEVMLDARHHCPKAAASPAVVDVAAAEAAEPHPARRAAAYCRDGRPHRGATAAAVAPRLPA